MYKLTRVFYLYTCTYSRSRHFGFSRSLLPKTHSSDGHKIVTKQNIDSYACFHPLNMLQVWTINIDPCCIQNSLHFQKQKYVWNTEGLLFQKLPQIRKTGYSNSLIFISSGGFLKLLSWAVGCTQHLWASETLQTWPQLCSAWAWGAGGRFRTHGYWDLQMLNPQIIWVPPV